MADAHGDLVVALQALGEALDVTGPEGSDPASVALGRIAARTTPPPRRASSWRRPAALAAAALVVAALVLVAVPGSRAALARWLGVGSVRIVTTDDPVPELSGPYDLGEAVALDVAIDRAPGPLVPDGLGRPDAAYVGAPTGAVTVVWRASDDLPPLAPGPEGAGLVITALPAAIADPRLTKVGSAGTLVEATTVGDHRGYWIAGSPHVVHTGDGNGDAEPGRVRLAGNTLLWEDGDVTYRLESALGRDEAVAMAERITGAGETG